MEREPAARCSFFDSKILNVSLHAKRSFRSLKHAINEGQKTANSGNRNCSKSVVVVRGNLLSGQPKKPRRVVVKDIPLFLLG